MKEIEELCVCGTFQTEVVLEMSMLPNLLLQLIFESKEMSDVLTPVVDNDDEEGDKKKVQSETDKLGGEMNETADSAWGLMRPNRRKESERPLSAMVLHPISKLI